MKKFFDTLFKGIEILIAVFLAVMIVLTFLNVVLRYMFNKGLAWSEEIARLCFIYLVYLGSIGAMRDNQHLIIDSVLSRVPSLAQKIIYTLVQAGIIWIMIVLVRGSWGLMMQNIRDRWVVTHFPWAGVYAAGLIAGVSIAILAVINLVRLFVLKISVPDLLVMKSGSESEEMDAIQ
ncbi:MAG: TRAP transporter small permease [Spirochaetaceae bacterium]|jgi:TRAP-type C4-dicarboxylate transport system permease small subunit|nr:TRAP transporter small permease [Spirochaetaceae bacterium]